MSAWRTNILTFNINIQYFVIPTIEVKKDDDNNKAEEFNLETTYRLLL